MARLSEVGSVHIFYTLVTYNTLLKVPQWESKQHATVKVSDSQCLYELGLILTHSNPRTLHYSEVQVLEWSPLTMIATRSLKMST
jgi:hypothetical protein